MTSIEWLIDQMFRQGYFDGNKPLSITNLDHLQQQAVEMHKEEIKNAWDNRNKDVIKSDGKTSEKYYQETFVSKGSDEVELPKHSSVISENGNELLFDKEGNLIKELPKQETLYTEEQVREVVKMAQTRKYNSHFYNADEIIQSLKQPKKD
jgi:hypothetical protein